MEKTLLMTKNTTMMKKSAAEMTKNVTELNVGNEWTENRRRVRMTGSRPHPVHTIVWIDVVDLGTGEPRALALYRENRRIIERDETPDA